MKNKIGENKTYGKRLKKRKKKLYFYFAHI